MHYYNPVIETYTVIGVAWIGDPSVNCQSSRLLNIYARVRRLDLQQYGNRPATQTDDDYIDNDHNYKYNYNGRKSNSV